MALGGGTFITQNKTLPGAYINFVSAGNNVTMGERGTAVLALPLNWGKTGGFITIDSADYTAKAAEILGYERTDKALLLVNECMKRAKKLLLWRLDGGENATATVGELTVTAVCSGTRGNDISVAVYANTDSTFDVVTYLEGIEYDRQTVSAVGELKKNCFVSFSGENITAAAAVKLAGGSNGTVTGKNYSDFLAAAEKETFSVIGCTVQDKDTKALYAEFTKRLRDDEGKKIVCVMGDYAGDYEGIISVKNGVVLENGETLDKYGAVCWVTGASAAAEVNESLTNAAYDGAVGVDVKYTKSDYEKALKDGEFVFYDDGGKARVLADINTLVTFTPAKNSDFTENRCVRALDGWANDVAALFSKSYLGTVTNSDTGRSLFKSDIVTLGRQYEAIDAISDFSPDDITVVQGAGKRDVRVDMSIKPNGSMEKLYMTVQVN